MSRTAVVTGGAGGIGGAIVTGLTEAGHDVAILDRSGEFAVDLADPDAVREVAERLGARDVLVHAAAAFDRAALEDLDLATWRRVQSVNVESALWLCQALTPAMRERGRAWRARTSSKAAGGRLLSVKGVRVIPGATQLTVIPLAPSGLANARAIPTSVALLAT